MGSARKQSVKVASDMFEDVPVLRRKWQAGLRPGETLPHYEDVMLGSLGRLADHIVLLKADSDSFAVSRTGRYAQKWLGDERWDIPMSALPPDCATILSEAASNAANNNHPYLATAHCVRDVVDHGRRPHYASSIAEVSDFATSLAEAIDACS